MNNDTRINNLEFTGRSIYRGPEVWYGEHGEIVGARGAKVWLECS